MFSLLASSNSLARRPSRIGFCPSVFSREDGRNVSPDKTANYPDPPATLGSPPFLPYRISTQPRGGTPTPLHRRHVPTLRTPPTAVRAHPPVRRPNPCIEPLAPMVQTLTSRFLPVEAKMESTSFPPSTAIGSASYSSLRPLNETTRVRRPSWGRG